MNFRRINLFVIGTVKFSLRILIVLFAIRMLIGLGCITLPHPRDKVMTINTRENLAQLLFAFKSQFNEDENYNTADVTSLLAQVYGTSDWFQVFLQGDAWGRPLNASFVPAVENNRTNMSLSPPGKLRLWSSGCNGLNENGAGDDVIMCIEIKRTIKSSAGNE